MKTMLTITLMSLLLICFSGASAELERDDLEKIAAALKGSDEAAWLDALQKLAALNDPFYTFTPWRDILYKDPYVSIANTLSSYVNSDQAEHRSLAILALAGTMDLSSSAFPTFLSGYDLSVTSVSFSAPEMLWLVDDPDPLVRAAGLKIQRLKHPLRDLPHPAVPAAVKLLSDASPEVVVQAIALIKTFGLSDQHIDALNEFRMKEVLERQKPLDDPEFYGQPELLTCDMIIDRICSMIGDPDLHPRVRITAMRAAVAFRAERAADAILECLKDTDPAVRYSAVMAAGIFRLYDAADVLGELLEDEAEGEALWGHIRVPGENAWRTFDSGPSSTKISEAAMYALGELGDAREIPWMHTIAFAPQRDDLIVRHRAGVTAVRRSPEALRAGTAWHALAKIRHPDTLKLLHERGLESLRLTHGILRALGLSEREKLPALDDDRLRRLRKDFSDDASLFTIRRIYDAVGDADKVLRQVFSPAAGLADMDPLSLIAEFPNIRMRALLVLGRQINPAGLRDSLLEIAHEDDAALQWGAIYVLARAREPEAAELADKSPLPEEANARLLSGLALAELNRTESIDLLSHYLSDEHMSIRYLAALALLRFDHHGAIATMAEIAESRASWFPYNAVTALSYYGGKNAVYVLESQAYRKSYGEMSLHGLSRLALEGTYEATRLIAAMKHYGIVPIACAEHSIRQLDTELENHLRRNTYDSSAVRPWALAVCLPSARLVRLARDERAGVRSEAIEAISDLIIDNAMFELLAESTRDKVVDVRIAAVRALGLAAARTQDEMKQRAIATLKEYETSWNLRLQLESLAARARLGDATVAPLLERAIEEGPEWRRNIAHAGLAALGRGGHTQILRENLMAEMDNYNYHNFVVDEIVNLIRLLGWCGDASSVTMLRELMKHPAADPDSYDGGRSSMRLHAASKHAIWRLNRR